MQRNELAAVQPEENPVADADPATEPVAKSDPIMQSANMRTYRIAVGDDEYLVELEEIG